MSQMRKVKYNRDRWGEARPRLPPRHIVESYTPSYSVKDRGMLKSWPIENFKSIVNSGKLQLAPVTVLAGLNSSGKSSLLQSILMISQTLSIPPATHLMKMIAEK